MPRFYAITTDLGNALIANAFLLNELVNVSTFCVGDGGGSFYSPTPDMTELRREVWSGSVSHAEIDPDMPNVINYSAVLPHTVGGFTIREMCIKTAAGIMVGIANTPDIEKVSFDEGVSNDSVLMISLAVVHPEVMEFTIDPTVMVATRRDILLHNESDEAHADIRGELQNKVSKGALEKYDIQLAAGFTAPLKCYYTKTDNDVVQLVLYCLSDEPLPSGTSEVEDIPVLTMPAGFRPARTLEFPAILYNPHTYKFYGNSLRIYADGRGVLRRNNEVECRHVIANIAYDIT